MTELPARGPWSPRGCGNHKLVLGEIKSAGFFLSSMITFFLNMNQVVLSALAWTFTNRETSRDVPKSVPKRSENSVVDQTNSCLNTIYGHRKSDFITPHEETLNLSTANSDDNKLSDRGNPGGFRDEDWNFQKPYEQAV
ncbi:hypothetical protein F2P81_021950 [Scophthalmus maximus]|uniref:Uncharacterized protein n=1 Tax=Scophthalmus maximus TaxID=52904 RepID=A0A6A4RXM1_SCOMX|nr:hypothetical protein F2P81_021950 [Scophthalmus maximus]